MQTEPPIEKSYHGKAAFDKRHYGSKLYKIQAVILYHLDIHIIDENVNEASRAEQTNKWAVQTKEWTYKQVATYLHLDF